MLVHPCSLGDVCALDGSTVCTGTIEATENYWGCPAGPETKAMKSEYSSFPETKNPTWQSEFIAASAEAVPEQWLERICLA